MYNLVMRSLTYDPSLEPKSFSRAKAKICMACYGDNSQNYSFCKNDCGKSRFKKEDK